MGLFDVDTWASDKKIDELNTKLFGTVTDPSTRTQSKIRGSHRDINVTEKKEKKRRDNKGSSKTIYNGEESKVRRKRKNKENSVTKKANQSSERKVKKPKGLKAASTKVEVIETHCEGNESTSFADFLKAEPGGHGKGIGVLKKKRRRSSKKNKYKHLNEFRKSLQEEANETNANKSKVDIDLYAKLNSQVLVPHKTDKHQGNKNYENGNVASPSGTKNKLKKKKAKHPQKNIENSGTIDNEKESFRLENTDHSKRKKKLKKRKQDNSNVDDLVDPPKKKKGRTTEDSNKEIIRSMPKERQNRRQDGSDIDDLVDPSRKKKSRTTEDSNKEIIRSMQKQEIAKKSTLNVSHLGEALKQQSPKIENEPNTKAKEISKAKKNKNLSLRDRMLEQLNSSRFRYINEQLYSVPGHEVSIIGFFCKITLVNNHTIS